jgi:hypothetical protein
MKDFGRGPVPRLRKRRGGSVHFRHPATMPEIRLNAMVLTREGEASARRARCAPNLPDSWDESIRPAQKNWKRQRRGRKAWERRR